MCAHEAVEREMWNMAEKWQLACVDQVVRGAKALRRMKELYEQHERG